MFELIGAVLGLYVVYAIVRGEVRAHERMRWRNLARDEDPESYWMAVAIYGGLSIAMMTLF